MQTPNEALEQRANPEARPCRFCGHEAHLGACGELYTSKINGSEAACCCFDYEPMEVLEMEEI